jgi:hypothetical protein
VLYLALEDNRRRLQRRLTKYFGAFRDNWPSRLRIATEWRRLDQGGIDDLRDWCLSVEKPVLIAIDTLKKVRPRKRSGQSDYEADYESCEGLQKLAGDFGIAIMIAHHDRKMGADDVFDTVSGTLGLTGGVDAIALLKRQSSGITLHIEGRELPDTIEKAVRFDRTTCRWEIVGEAAEVLRSTERTKVLAALAAAPAGLGTADIMQATGMSSRGAADTLLSRMVDDELIRRPSRGIYALPSESE